MEETDVRNSRSRVWCFTLFASTDDQELDEHAFATPEAFVTVGEAVYGVVGLEVAPDTGREHLQGYVRFKNAVRFNSMRALFTGLGYGLHLEMANGTDGENQDYCSKDGRFCEFGEPAKQGKRSDLTRIRRRIEQGQSDLTIARSHFGSWVRYHESFKRYRCLLEANVSNALRNPEVVIIWGPPGSGKSKYVWDKVHDVPHYWKRDTTRWFQGYQGQKTVVLDDFTEDMFPPADLLSMLDRYPYEVEYKGGSLPFLAEKIYITSNTEPCEWYKYHPKDHRFVRWDMQNPLFRRLQDFGKVFKTTDLHVLTYRRQQAGSATGSTVPSPERVPVVSSHAPEPAAFQGVLNELFDGSSVAIARSMQLARGEHPDSGAGADLPRPRFSRVSAEALWAPDELDEEDAVPAKDKEEEDDEYVDATPPRKLVRTPAVVIDLVDEDSPARKSYFKKRRKVPAFLPSSSDEE